PIELEGHRVGEPEGDDDELDLHAGAVLEDHVVAGGVHRRGTLDVDRARAEDLERGAVDGARAEAGFETGGDDICLGAENARGGGEVRPYVWRRIAEELVRRIALRRQRHAPTSRVVVARAEVVITEAAAVA